MKDWPFLVSPFDSGCAEITAAVGLWVDIVFDQDKRGKERFSLIDFLNNNNREIKENVQAYSD